MEIAIPERLEHGEENRWIVLLVNDKKKSKPKRKASVEKRSEEKRKAIRRSPPSLSFWKIFWFVYESPSPVLLVFQQEGKADGCIIASCGTRGVLLLVKVRPRKQLSNGGELAFVSTPSLLIGASFL